MSTVIIADDHPLFLKGVRSFVEEYGLQVLGEAFNGHDAFELIKAHEPDLAIVDLEMPLMTGLEVAKEVKTVGLGTKIIILTFHKEIYLAQEADNLNLSGYLLKEFAIEEMKRCLDQVIAGQQFFSENLYPKITEEFSLLTDAKITPSEKKILRLIAEGLDTRQIAKRLFISDRTVEKHRSNIIQKLQLDKKTNALLLWAQKNKGLIF
ncbi:response regulator [Mongoliitalea daihaiensis]|uniref:response regulator n=1 Tax=Mongoliitalea daihaiensis TaxID=2782006 RepID=UPI001F1A9C50|nr:response regulator transcription factor [Mongoliitalea daihaiensis]UJP65629.1 response regulator transcription factor [Mongoliitalea daihaiensis]